MAGTVQGAAIGIDFGTNNARVGIWWNGRVEIIPNEYGNRVTPCYVAFGDAERTIGDDAVKQAFVNPTNTVFDVKQLIGRRYDDAAVRVGRNQWPFKIVAGPRNKPLIAVVDKGEEKQFSVEEIVSMILARMRKIAEAHLGTIIKDAVVSVPASFNNSQRGAIKDAAAAAGLNVLRIVSEPVAAAIAYGLNTAGNRKNVLVLDLGGSTLDVSLVEVGEGVVKVMATAGDANLGGKDFDERMLNHFARGVVNLTACELAKKALSSATEAVVEGSDFSATITRAEFEKLNKDLFAKCIHQVDKCLHDARMGKDTVDEVVLVGGSTRIPRIQQLLQDYFNGRRLCTSVNPDEAVAYGAAVLAAILSGGGDAEMKKLLVTDVTPWSVGLETAGGAMNTVIPKNTVIPTTAERVFSTYEDNQSAVVIKVFEGESGMTKKNNLLGEYELRGIFPAPKGVPQIAVGFEIDADGILSVVTEDRATGRKFDVVAATVGKEIGKKEDEKVDQLGKNRRRMRAKEELEKYVKDISRTVRDERVVGKRPQSSEGVRTVEETVERTMRWLERNQFGEAEEYVRKMKEAESVCNPIVAALYVPILVASLSEGADGGADGEDGKSP